MKKLLLACAGLALFASVMSVMLWRDLRAERELNAGLQARLAEAEAMAPRPVALPPATSRPPVVASVADARPEPASTEQRPAPVAQPAYVTSINQRDMMKDPEFRKARLVQLRLQMPERYPGLAEYLDLSPEQADRLFDQLAENELEMMNVTALIIGANGQIDQAQAQEMARQQQQMRAQQDAALGAVLGDARMGQWRDYQQTQGARQRVTQLGRTLEGMGMPLTAAQRRPLTEAMVAEQMRQQQEQLAISRELRATLAQNPGGQPDPQTQARLQEENYRRQVESNRRLLDIASAHLTARQLELYRSQLESQLTVNRISSRMQREAAERNRAAAPVVVTGPVQAAVPLAAPPVPGSNF